MQQDSSIEQEAETEAEQFFILRPPSENDFHPRVRIHSKGLIIPRNISLDLLKVSHRHFSRNGLK